MSARHRAACVCLFAFIAGLASSAFGQIGRAGHEDRNQDGHVDVWRYYDRHGHVDSAFRDTNFDGRIDTIEDYRADQLTRRELDLNFDSRIDVVEEFDAAKSTRTTADLDSDGVADALVLSADSGTPVVFMADAGASPPVSVEAVAFTPAPFVDPFGQSPGFRPATAEDEDLTFTADTSSVVVAEEAVRYQLTACGQAMAAAPLSSNHSACTDKSDRAPPVPA